MGHSAEAMLIMGFDIGCPDDDDEVPDWLMQHAPHGIPTDDDEYDDPDLYDVPVDRILGTDPAVRGVVTLYEYGYHDQPHFILGIRVAWAVDYTSNEVKPHELAERYQEWHTKVREALDKLGAPPTAKIGMYLCPSG